MTNKNTRNDQNHISLYDEKGGLSHALTIMCDQKKIANLLLGLQKNEILPGSTEFNEQLSGTIIKGNNTTFEKSWYQSIYKNIKTALIKHFCNYKTVVALIEQGKLNDDIYFAVQEKLSMKQKQKLIELLDQEPRYYLERNNDYVKFNDTLKEELHGKPQFVLGKNIEKDDYYYTN